MLRYKAVPNDLQVFLEPFWQTAKIFHVDKKAYMSALIVQDYPPFGNVQDRRSEVSSVSLWFFLRCSDGAKVLRLQFQELNWSSAQTTAASRHAVVAMTNGCLRPFHLYQTVSKMKCYELCGWKQNDKIRRSLLKDLDGKGLSIIFRKTHLITAAAAAKTTIQKKTLRQQGTMKVRIMRSSG